ALRGPGGNLKNNQVLKNQVSAETLEIIQAGKSRNQAWLECFLPGECVPFLHSDPQRAILPRLEVDRLGSALIVSEHRFQFVGRLAAQHDSVNLIVEDDAAVVEIG